MGNVGKYNRSVSIIGVGCTPFMYTLDNPETEGLTEGEMYGYAALEAMKDAGIEAADIDFFYHGQANPGMSSNYITPAIHVADWCGLRGKGGLHHSEGCCTGYIALEQAVNAVAAGKYDIVLTGAVDMADSMFVMGKPAHQRRKFEMQEFLASLPMIYDRAYTRPMEAGAVISFDDWIAAYMREYNVSAETMDEALNMLAVQSRRAAAKNPLALEKREYADIAKQQGFDDVMEFMKSPFNPKMSQFLRVSGTELKCDGAAAVIVCPTELALKISKRKPIEIIGTGTSSLEARQCQLERRATAEAARQAYEMSGVKPEEIDLFYANDMIISSQLLAAEECGYLPKGEGWKYVLDGRTAFDGDRPINTNGGRTSFGHAHAASGLADYYEAVKQMRGECGDRQVKKLPKTTFVRGFGGGQNVATAILRTVEEGR